MRIPVLIEAGTSYFCLQVDERQMPLGAALHAAIALEFLERNAGTGGSATQSVGGGAGDAGSRSEL